MTETGRWARFKRLLTSETADTPYQCQNCRAGLERQYQVCPECGGYDIRRSEWVEAVDRPGEHT